MAQVNVIGRITADLELKTSEKSNPYVRFDIAENIGSRQALHADGFREQIKAMNQQRAMEAELGNNEPICDAVDSSYHSTDDGEHFCITEAPIDGDHEDLPL